MADQIVPAFGAQGLVLMTAQDGRLRVAGHRGYSPEFVASFDGTPLTAHFPPVRAMNTGTPAFYRTYADFLQAYPQALRYARRNAWAFSPPAAPSAPSCSPTTSPKRSRRPNARS